MHDRDSEVLVPGPEDHARAAESDAPVGETAADSHVPSLGSLAVGFLFNHEALHQVGHAAPLIAELRRSHPELDISVLTSSDEQMALIRSNLPADLSPSVSFIPLRLSSAAERINRVARYVAPFKRVAILRSNLDILGRFDALIVPESTTTTLKSRFGLDHLKLIYTHHGAGDRSVAFGDELKHFDFILMAGSKIRDRLLSLGLIEEGGYAIVGYPKFDNVLERVAHPPRLFPNDKPTVLYNPHFEPRLSSFFTMGLQVLDLFAASRDYNLVFAPHVMLGKRRIHASLEHFTVRFRHDVPEKYLRHPHIRIDMGSESCVDMTYTLGADIYLGDASSQVYEFLLRPRPCIFLNSHRAQWVDNPDYLHWRLGPVVDDVSQLGNVLARAEADHASYQPVQEALFAKTIEISDVPSSRRAAEAVARFLAQGGPASRPGGTAGVPDSPVHSAAAISDLGPVSPAGREVAR